ncbi:hypothetical protein VCHENC02_4778, partial [Vibrio harveyi]
MYSLNKQPCHL